MRVCHRPFRLEASLEIAIFYSSYNNLKKQIKEQSLSDLTVVVSAAHLGRVGTLIVAIDERIWGRYNFANDQLEVHSIYRPGDVDLLNLAAIQTVLNGGSVYARHKEEILELMPLSAIFRF